MTTQATALNEQILEKLAELGGKVVGDDDVQYGPGWVIPDMYKEDLSGAIDFLVKYRDENEEAKRFSKAFPYKPWDGAVAIVNVFRKYFGVSVVQRNSFFTPVGYQAIPISPTEEINAPYGKCVIPTFKGTLHIKGTEGPDGYTTFVMVVDAPKKFEEHVNGLFKLVRRELDESSIYRGKAIDGAEMPNFLDLTAIDPSKIVYSQLTLHQLEANLWTPIQYPDVCSEKGLDPKRAVLLEGDYGTGKTLAAMWTAKLCEDQSRTFIMCNPKDNNVFECLQTAALYQPSCLFVEDIDKLTETTDRDAMARLLDEFDGFKAKNKEVAIVLTTNRVGEIHKGMLRPGRMDAVIKITKLDIEGMVKLIGTMFKPGELADDIDFDQIYETMQEFTPAFMKEVCQKVKLYAITRVAEGESEQYTTTDFLAAADEMSVHYRLHTGAADLKQKPSVDSALSDVVLGAMDNVPVTRVDDDDWEIRTATKKGDPS